MKEVARQVLVAVLVAAILWLGSEIKNLVSTVMELRGDVDRLYSMVDDLSRETQ